MSLSHMSVLEMNSLSNITELDVNWKTDLSRDLSTIRSKYSWIPKLNQLTNCCCVPCDHCSKWARIIEQNLVKCCALRTVGSSYWHCPPLLSNNNTPIRDAWRMSNLPSSSSVSVCTHCQVAQGYIYCKRCNLRAITRFLCNFLPFSCPQIALMYFLHLALRTQTCTMYMVLILDGILEDFAHSKGKYIISEKIKSTRVRSLSNQMP